MSRSRADGTGQAEPVPFDEDDKPDFGEWMGRIIGTIVTLVFLGVATVGFYKADGYFSAQRGLYSEADSRIRELDSVEAVFPAADGELVHATGVARVLSGAVDPLMGVAADAVCIRRVVRYYQWREEESGPAPKQGVGKRYFYDKRWVEKPIDSSRFRMQSAARRNAILADIGAAVFPAAAAMLGGYWLEDPVKAAFPDAGALPVVFTAGQLTGIQARVFAGREGGRLVHAMGNELYFGSDPERPSIGDIRVMFTASWPGKVSVVARVAGSGFDEYIAGNGERMALVREGEVSAGRMLGGATLLIMLGQWGIRLGLAVAYFLLFSLLGIVYGGRRRGLGYVGAALGCAVMGVVWRMHRPEDWGFVFFLAAAAAVLGMRTQLKDS